MKQCANCGQAVKDEYAFCSACGQPLISADPVSAEETPVVEETPVADETPVVAEAPVVTEAPVVAEAPVAAEAPVVGETPIVAEAPAADAISEGQDPAVGMPFAPMAAGDFQKAQQTQPYVPPVAGVAFQPPKQKRGHAMRHTGAGLIIAGVLLVAAVVGLLLTSRLDVWALLPVIDTFGIYALAAIAVALSMRAKGPDLSIGAMMGIAPVICGLMLYFGGNLYVAVVLTVLICAVLGLINGMLTAYLRMPAVLLTLLTGLVARAILTMMVQGRTFELPSALPAFEPYWALVLVGAALLPAFLLVLFSKLGVPRQKRERGDARVSGIIAYVLSAAFAALAGMLLLKSMGTGPIGLEPDAHNAFFIIFVFAMLGISRALDNRFAPVLFCLVPALTWAAGRFALQTLMLETHVYAVIYGGLALALFVTAYACRYEKRDKDIKQTRQDGLPLSQ